MSLFFILALVASIHEAWMVHSNCLIDAKQKILVVRFLHCFSLIKNGKKLMSTKAPPGNLACLNGLRKLFYECSYALNNNKTLFLGVVSLTWVVLGHSLYIFDRTRIISNYRTLADEVINIFFQSHLQSNTIFNKH